MDFAKINWRHWQRSVFDSAPDYHEEALRDFIAGHVCMNNHVLRAAFKALIKRMDELESRHSYRMSEIEHFGAQASDAKSARPPMTEDEMRRALDAIRGPMTLRMQLATDPRDLIN